jgi:hypothetical protein
MFGIHNRFSHRPDFFPRREIHFLKKNPANRLRGRTGFFGSSRTF